MSIFRFLTLVSAVCLARPCWPQPAPLPLSGELLRQAIENNRELLAVRQRAEEARGLLRQAAVRPAATLEVTGATGRPLGTRGEEQYGAGIAQTFETAGKRPLRVRAAQLQLALAEAEYDERVRQLRFEIRARCAEFAAEAERMQALKRLGDSYQRSLEMMKARVEQGDAAALERDLLAVELSRTAALQDAAAGRLGGARADLARLAGLAGPVAAPVAAPEPLPGFGYDLEPLKLKGLAMRPDLRAATVLSQQGEAETALAKAQGHADLTLSAGYSRVYSRFDDQYGLSSSGVPARLRDRDDVLSVGVSVPLFGRNRNQGNIEAAVARSRAAQYRRESLERAIPIEIEGAWKRLSSASRSYRALEETVLMQSEKNLEVIRRAYELGQLRLLDVLNEQRRLLDTQLSGIDAKLDALRALAGLELAVGGELR